MAKPRFELRSICAQNPSFYNAYIVSNKYWLPFSCVSSSPLLLTPFSQAVQRSHIWIIKLKAILSIPTKKASFMWMNKSYNRLVNPTLARGANSLSGWSPTIYVVWLKGIGMVCFAVNPVRGKLSGKIKNLYFLIYLL